MPAPTAVSQHPGGDPACAMNSPVGIMEAAPVVSLDGLFTELTRLTFDIGGQTRSLARRRFIKG